VGIITDWVNSSPSLLLVLLAVAGLAAIKKNGFDPSRRSEFRLCLWLALAIGAQNLFAHPTFPQYFIFLIPFLTVLGVIGFYAVAARLANSDRPRRPLMVLLCIAALCLGNTLYGDWDNGDNATWRQLEHVADKVRQVTPKNAPLVAPEQLYFLLRWPVPPGMEHDDAHKLKFTGAENARLHVLPEAELDQGIKAGDFPTAVICDDDDRASEVEGWKVYSQKSDIGECTVFWQVKKPKVESRQSLSIMNYGPEWLFCNATRRFQLSRDRARD
jgi:hypothetical protein